MSATTTALLLPLATSLLNKWISNSQFGGNRTPPEPHDLASGLGRLSAIFSDFRSGLEGLSGSVAGLPESDAKFKKKVDKFADEFERVDKYIRLFQTSTGGLLEDGVLGNSTLNALFRSLVHPDEPLPDSGIANTVGMGRFQYFVESIPAVPTEDASIRILARAWESWKRVCGVRSRQVASPALANVIVRSKHLDGSGPILGQASLGPLAGSVLELEMDAGELWNPTSFEGALCHEIGHLMGLDHNSTPGTLMNAVIAHGVTKPKVEDAQKARAKYGMPDLPPDPGSIEVDDNILG